VHNLSTATAQNLITLDAENLNKITTRVPTHVPTSRVQSVPWRHISLHVPCMQPAPLNPSALRLEPMDNVLLVLDLNALNAPLGPITLFANRPGLIHEGIILSI